MMATNDIKFSTDLITDVYKPLEVLTDSTSPGKITVIVTNYGTSDLSNLGLYVSIASNQGDVDNPADLSPHIDYQDLLTWGSYAYRTGLAGGLTIEDPVNPSLTTRVRRGVGSSFSDKIPLPPLGAGLSYKIMAVMEVPASVTARRMFVNITVE